MAKRKYIIALDAGTTSVRAFVYDTDKNAFVHRAQQEVGQTYPKSGWVEQDANEIYYKSSYVLNDCISFVGAENVAGIGITNQRLHKKNDGARSRRLFFGKQNKMVAR